MTDIPVYLETWGLWSYEGPHNDPHLRISTHGASICIGTIAEAEAAAVEGRPENHECLATMCADSEERTTARARLAAAAPAMVRALLLAEMGTRRFPYDDGVGDTDPGCGVCGESCGAFHGLDHEVGCALDAALKAAGFPDAASRDEARRRIEEDRKR